MKKEFSVRYPRIKELREANGWNQTYTGSLVGMSQTGYSKYETGENDVPIPILLQLADIYNTSVDYMLGRTNQKEPYPKQ